MANNERLDINELADYITSAILDQMIRLPKVNAEARFYVEQSIDRVEYIYDAISAAFNVMARSTFKELFDNPLIEDLERPEIPKEYEDALMGEYMKIPDKRSVVNKIRDFLEEMKLDEIKINKSYNVKVLH